MCVWLEGSLHTCSSPPPPLNMCREKFSCGWGKMHIWIHSHSLELQFWLMCLYNALICLFSFSLPSGLSSYTRNRITHITVWWMQQAIITSSDYDICHLKHIMLVYDLFGKRSSGILCRGFKGFVWLLISIWMIIFILYKVLLLWVFFYQEKIPVFVLDKMTSKNQTFVCTIFAMPDKCEICISFHCSKR